MLKCFKYSPSFWLSTVTVLIYGRLTLIKPILNKIKRSILFVVVVRSGYVLKLMENLFWDLLLSIFGLASWSPLECSFCSSFYNTAAVHFFVSSRFIRSSNCLSWHFWTVFLRFFTQTLCYWNSCSFEFDR